MKEKPAELELPNNKYYRHVLAYLRGRGYFQTEAKEVAERYLLTYVDSGPFKDRVLIPVYNEKYELLTWTGRAIGLSKVRYKTLSEKFDEKHNPIPARTSIKNTLLNYQFLYNNQWDKLIICEGPFDAIRLDYFGRDMGVVSTCLFGKSISAEQINLLDRARHRFRTGYITLDSDAELDMLRLSQQLSHLDIKVKKLPNGVGDPADMTPGEIGAWIKDNLTC